MNLAGQVQPLKERVGESKDPSTRASSTVISTQCDMTSGASVRPGKIQIKLNSSVLRKQLGNKSKKTR